MCVNRKTIFPFALVIVLSLTGSSVFAKGGKNRKAGAEGEVRGTVAAVTAGSITIDTRKGGSRELKLSGSTVFERLGKHGEVKPLGKAKTDAPKRKKAGKAPRIKVGSRAVITQKDGVAEKVSIKRQRHKKTGAAPEATPGTGSGSTSGAASAASTPVSSPATTSPAPAQPVP